jgi:HAD superfamily hydrolase (TIGR01509 family)
VGYIKEKNKLSQDLDYLVNYAREKYFNHLTSEDCEIDLVEGVRDFIRELHERGTKLAIASSSPLNVIVAVVKIFKLEEYFEVLVTGDMVEKSKPEPDIFLYAAEKLGAAPNECIVVEDSHNGARAAKKAGMKCIGYKNPSSGNQDISMADLVVETFSEVDVDRLFK